MFIYVKPKGYTGKDLVTLGTYSSLVEIVKQYQDIDIKVRPSEGEKISAVTIKHFESSLRAYCGKDVNAFIKPMVWRYPFMESGQENLWSEAKCIFS